MTPVVVSDFSVAFTDGVHEANQHLRGKQIIGFPKQIYTQLESNAAYPWVRITS